MTWIRPLEGEPYCWGEETDSAVAEVGSIKREDLEERICLIAKKTSHEFQNPKLKPCQVHISVQALICKIHGCL